MSELIDRQALIKQLKDENIPFNADINEIINIQPIAFDIDNIVEKLEELPYGRSYHDYAEKGIVHKYLERNDVLDIVKQEINNGLE